MRALIVTLVIGLSLGADVGAGGPARSKATGSGHLRGNARMGAFAQ
jgi:hypothetical protein